ncbi:uncharacterized protein [Palaemon carinicauda]|uniref:uncharacterized protein n=1 Tax=Palaemon carinicauda TaxID=392227 RepID=UPI0035B625CD
MGANGNNRSDKDSFNLLSALKLVPQFNEEDVSEFLISFERIAKKLKWPRDMWPTLVQCRLKGKSQRVYNTLNEGLSSDYDSVKAIILKAYDLVPEAYRQKFRNFKKNPDMTFVEFARKKEQFMDDWLKSKEVDTLGKLRELILTEEFKRSVLRELKIHLEELKIDSLQEVAIASDEYSLAHWQDLVKDFSKKFSPRNGHIHQGKPYQKRSTDFDQNKGVNRNVDSSKNGSVESRSYVNSSRSGGGSERRESQESSLRCYWCNRKGHITANCFAMKNYLERNKEAVNIVSAEKSSKKEVSNEILGGFPDTIASYPLETMYPETEYYKGTVKLAIVDSLPLLSIDMLFANDLVLHDEANYFPFLSVTELGDDRYLDVSVCEPTSVITRFRAREIDLDNVNLKFDDINVQTTDMMTSSCSNSSSKNILFNDVEWDVEALKEAQANEFSNFDDSNFDVDVDDLSNPFFLKKKVCCTESVGHFGVRKTFQKLSEHFFWPGMRRDVKRHELSCKVCQLVGKPNQKFPKAPLIPIPSVGEPFREVIIDVIGPLPRTRGGHEYILTMVDRMSRFPEAVPLRSIRGEKIVEALVGFFTRFGIPKIIQSDCGTNFTSRYFKRKMNELAINHVTSSPYHPESQGQVERFHQTLKSILRKFCLETGYEWDKEIPFALFAIRSTPNETLGFSPFQLIFGHCVRGPLDVVREHWEGETPDMNVLDYLSNLQEKLHRAWTFARENLTKAQATMKTNYDVGTQMRHFEPGDRVLVLLPLPGNPLKARFSGPWKHLEKDKATSLTMMINDYKDLFQDVPGRTNILEHDVDVGEASPIKQSPYRLNPFKRDIAKDEVKYMLDHGLVEPSFSPWSSPVVLVKKEGGEHRLCFDYRKVNSLTKTDSFPLPRVEDCIDRVGSAKYISKFDLLKGYWQVGLSPRARKISAFVTGDRLYECKVMPFGVKNAAATFQRLMNFITCDLEGCVVYIDDLIIYSDDWETHLKRIRALFEILRKAGLVVNLRKSDFAQAKVIYLGHEIGLGKVAPKKANVEAISGFPAPQNRRGVRRFLGMVGYYRRFVKNFSDIAHPLTNLLKKDVKFIWDEQCQESFDKLKASLMTFPLLRSPDFSLPFCLATDVSDVGLGAVLLQRLPDGTTHTVAYFSKKLLPAERKYSTLEKEALCLVKALLHFELYLSSSPAPIDVLTDHNPLIFINKLKNKNQRILRWNLILQEYNLNIRHISGKSNVVPDTLSRAFEKE